MIGFGAAPTHQYTVVMWLTGPPSAPDADELRDAGWQITEHHAHREVAAWSGPDAAERAATKIPVAHRDLFGGLLRVYPADTTH